MTKKSFKFFLTLQALTALLFIDANFIWAKESSLYIDALENGLTLIVNEDKSSPILNVEFLCRAGFQSQESWNAGLFPLYPKILAEYAPQKSSIFNVIPLNAECNSDCVRFYAQVPPKALDEFLAALSDLIISPVLPDNIVEKCYREMQKECLEYSESTAGFINSAIDARVFSSAPWKQDSGIYPAVFNSWKPREVRVFLLDIKKRWYTPDNCAIFINGSCSEEKAYTVSKKYFQGWQGTVSLAERESQKSALQKKQNDGGCKKYIIHSEEFSEDFTQIVMQWESLSMAQADILSAGLTGFTAPLYEKLSREEILSIRSRDYVTAASAQKSSSSRFIIQALMENPDPVVQTKLFALKAQEACLLSRQEFVAAQKSISAKYNWLQGNSEKKLRLISDFWALNPLYTADGFLEKFNDFTFSIMKEDEKSIYKKIQNESPYIFVLTGEKTFSTHKDEFLEKGFMEITRENSSWYKNKILSVQAENLAKKSQKQKDESPYIYELQQDETTLFCAENSDSIKSTALLNGIPLTVKENPGTKTATISVSIKGGEAQSPENHKFLRTVIVNLFTRNIQIEINSLRRNSRLLGDTELKAWTENSVSYITLSCQKEDTALALKAFTNALIYGEVTPVTLDRLVSAQKYQYMTNSANLSFQMKNNVLKYLYRGTEYEKIYDLEKEALSKTDINDIYLAYNSLLDASLYGIVIAGDIDLNTALKYSEETFGLLKEQKKNLHADFPKAKFKNKTRNVQLTHTFFSDIPVEKAPKESPILVPTKEFFDPAQIYFIPPEDQDRAAYNAVLQTLSFLISRKLEKVTFHKSSVQETPGYIQVENQKKGTVLEENYKTARKELLENLNENSLDTVNTIIYLWEQEQMSKASTNEGTCALIQESILESRPTLYLEQYLYISEADSGTFIEIINKYFPQEPAMKVYSVDAR